MDAYKKFTTKMAKQTATVEIFFTMELIRSATARMIRKWVSGLPTTMTTTKLNEKIMVAFEF